MLKQSASSGKAEVKAKVEAKMKKVRSSLNLELNLDLPQTLRPCWTTFLSILRGVLLLSKSCRPVKSDVPTEFFRSLVGRALQSAGFTA